MRIRVRKTIKTSDGIVCFTAGKVYNVKHKGYWSVTLTDDRGVANALLNDEFEVTC